jgi:hypothetical protein
VRGSGWRCSTFTGPSGRHTGQGKRDNRMARGCASELMGVRRGPWRCFRRGDGRTTRGEDVHSTPARCSTIGWLPEHRWVRPRGRAQMSWRAREGSGEGLGETSGEMARSKKQVLKNDGHAMAS